MYAKYVTNATSTQAQVINDIAQLLSGAAISALSASCDKVNTTLLSTVAPGWTLTDAAAASSGCVVSAPDAAALTTKYVDLYASSAALIAAVGYETWNAGTHAGTNPTNAISNTLAYSASAVNTYLIFATPRSFYIGTPGTSVGIGAFEFTRDCQYLVGTTYPCFAMISSVSLQGANTMSFVPRLKSLIAAGDLSAANAGVYVATISPKNTPTVTSPARAPNAAIYDSTGTQYQEVRPLWLVAAPSAIIVPILGKVYDILEINANAGNTLDTFSDGTNTYAIVNVGTCSYAFKQA